MEREKIVVRHGKWSICYKQGNTFIKEYIYPDIHAIQREALASKAAWGVGLFTPRYIDSCIQNGRAFSVFEYCDMLQIDVDTIKSPFYVEQILNILASFGKFPWDCEDAYWLRQLNEFNDALNYIDDETNNLVFFLNKLRPVTFIHGDFTCDNLGVNSQRIIVYDFQHGSLGPAGWDKAYLASTMAPKDSSILKLDETELKMAFVISAIRYGRGIRKSSADLVERQTLYSLWKAYVKC